MINTATEPAFYKLPEVETILNLSYQTIYRLCRLGILVKTGRSKGVLISAQSVHALVTWMEQGGDKWDAPKIRRDRPVSLPAPVVRAASGKTAKPAATGTPSASTENSTNIERLASKPPLRVLNSLRKN
jgi:hypothetical protein